MSRRVSIRSCLALAGAILAVGVAYGNPATTTPAAEAEARIRPPVVGPLTPGARDSLRLARAVYLWRQGDPRRAVPLLKAITSGGETRFADAARARFLLAVAHLRLGDRAAFLALTDSSEVSARSPYRPWLDYARLMLTGTTPDGGASLGPQLGHLPGAAVMASARLLATGRTEAASRLLKRDAGDQESAEIGRYLRTLAGAHTAADTAAALGILDAAAPAPRNTPATRRALMLSGQQAGEAGDWAAAASRFAAADSELAAESAWLDSLTVPATAATAWRLWSEVLPRPNELPRPVWAWSRVLRDQGWAATDLTRNAALGQDPPPAALTLPDTAAPEARQYATTNGPTADQWRQWDELAAEVATTRLEYARRAGVLSDLQAERDRQLAYLDTGRRRAADRLAELQLRLAELDRLMVRLNAALDELDRTRAAALRQFAARGAAMVDQLRASLIYLQATRHFRILENRAPGTNPPAGPAWEPAVILDLEEALSGEIVDFLEMFAARTPELIERSCAEIWTPRLVADSPALRQTLSAQQGQGRRLLAALDSTSLALPIASRVAGAAARLAVQHEELKSLQNTQAALRRAITDQVVVRGRARLDHEREALDYLRANARYWLATAAPDTDDDPAQRATVRLVRQRASQSLRTYLKRYPDGPARAESRYRLADLALLQARDDFQDRMAGFLQQRPTAGDLHDRDLAPFVDYQPAVVLYRQILAEDPDYVHLPAVLFQLGMILGDAGDAAADGYLTDLVTRFPQAPFNQEAWLRLGDRRFESRDFAGCLDDFRHAADGGDPALRGIALYKLGWARFELDRFSAAADAFGELLDQSLTTTAAAAVAASPRTDTDLAGEAREYLVQALVRAGGAPAFAAHFDRVGERPYAADILRAMGHQSLGASLFGAAIACDRLWLARYGEQDQAVAVARRLVDAYGRWHQPDAARDAHLALAARFLPTGPWCAAGRDSALEAAAQDFAQSAYRQSAGRRHQLARRSDAPADWRAALALYDTFLAVWPASQESPRMHHQAGEAAFRLGRHALALAHFTVAAKQAGGPDSTALAHEAAWQTVAVCDAWYRGARSGTTGAGSRAGPDSLAHRLLDRIDAFQTRYPGDDREPELLWRAGQVAYAHQWYDRAAHTLARLAHDYPADTNALQAVRMSGDARYQRHEFLAAAASYQQTLDQARGAGNDSLARDVAPLVPRCHYQNAEQVAAADTVVGPATAAPLFAQVAARWPDFPQADLALYRAGLGFAAGNDPAAATTAWRGLLARYPDSSYGRDSALQIAAVNEGAGNWRLAADALAEFSSRFAADPDAAEALLKASDLMAAGGDSTAAADLKTTFVQRFADRTETVMAILEERAARALTALDAAAAPDSDPDLAAYLAAATAHPRWAAPSILAGIDFRKAELARGRYLELPLKQPLPAAVKTKQALLEQVLALYGTCAGHGVVEYTRAAGFRIGEVITRFGDALLASERPPALAGDDLLAYEDVLNEQSWPFYDRGEAAWIALLKQAGPDAADPGQWLARTRSELWPRVAERFAHMPETPYPVVAAAAPAPRAADTPRDGRQ